MQASPAGQRVALVVVLIDEGFDLGFEIARQEVVLEQDAVLQDLVPTLDLALGLRVTWRTAGVLHTLVLHPFRQLTQDVAGTVVAKQSWLVDDMGLVTPRCFQSQIQRIGHVLCPHVCAEPPRDNEAAVIVQDRAEIKPSLPNDLEIGEVGLPELVDCCGLVLELIGGLDRQHSSLINVAR